MVMSLPGDLLMFSRRRLCTYMAVLWDVAELSLVETDRRFKVACCLNHQGVTFQKTIIFMSPCLFPRPLPLSPCGQNLPSHRLLHSDHSSTQNTRKCSGHMSVRKTQAKRDLY
jgi:hypothetical protein